MKKYSIIIAVVIGIAGYLLGSYFPIRGFFQGSQPTISGNAVLKVTVLKPDKSPATNLEVDVATKAGQPLQGGIEQTDQSGMATFHIKPGTYAIFFNAYNFPSDLLYKDNFSVNVQEGTEADQTINLYPNN